MTKFIIPFLAFLIGYELLLPTSTVGLEWYRGPHFIPSFWMTRMELFKGFFLKDLLVSLLLFEYFILKKRLYKRTNLQIIYIYIALALYGTIIAIVTWRFYDIFENLRLCFIAFVIYLITEPKVRLKFTPLFLLGLFVSGILNLIVSYRFDIYGLRPVFFLVNQNGPGPVAALHLFFLPKLKLSKYSLLSIGSVLFLIAVLSLSKVAYLILILAGMKFMFSRPKAWSLILGLGLIIIFSSSGLVDLAINQKFGSNELSVIDSKGGDQTRLAYYKAQMSILFSNPFGVSYSGFYDEIMNTSYAKEGIIEESDAERANPHSTFLYYISSHGVFGIIILLWFLFDVIVNYKRDILLLSALVVYMGTIPYLLVSYFFVIPMVLFNRRKLS